jgi:hypothetical protein
MIRLTSAAQALALRGTIPELAVVRMLQFEGTDGFYDPEEHGHIVVLEEGDDIAAMPEVGENGLLQLIDEEWPVYEYEEAFRDAGGVVYEMVIQIDDGRTIAVIIADYPGLDAGLRAVLEKATESHPPFSIPRFGES